MFYPTPKQMKTIEENSDKNGVSYRDLLINAGGALTMLIYKISEDRDISSGVVFICGNGNNGGDGLISAKELAGNGIPVTVVLACGDPSTECDGKISYSVASPEEMQEIPPEQRRKVVISGIETELLAVSYDDTPVPALTQEHVEQASKEIWLHSARVALAVDE